jgi:UDP-N-acetylglucosamine/UDP-N-acetylgalactosamine diphosphorylase
MQSHLDQHGQAHLLNFSDQLAPDAKAGLLSQIDQLNLARLNDIFTKATSTHGDSDAIITPLPDDAQLNAIDASADQLKQWESIGLNLIAQNKVAVILMAGGQGTRLGSSAPKGCFNIGLLSGKSLFQLQAERIRKLQQLAAATVTTSVRLPWFIMTSQPTRQATEEHFKQHAYFGLDPTHVYFFNQGTLPCFDFDGKILMESKSSLTSAPDGNGGIYAALDSTGVLAKLEALGVEHVHSYCVDNCLVKVADPVFIGACAQHGYDCAAKVVRKTDPTEPVGVVCQRNGKAAVVEYSEISKELSEKRSEDGKLVYRAANIANHYMTTAFLREAAELANNVLEYHVAKKKVKHVDPSTGEVVVPTQPNAIKLELFVFDVFPFATKFGTMEVNRSTEFSPLKNANAAGVDCADTSKRDILSMHASWLKQAGAVIAPDVLVELDAAYSYSGEGILDLHGKTVVKSGIVSNEADLKALLG